MAEDAAAVTAPVEVAAEAAAPAPVVEGPIDPLTALQRVLKRSMVADGLRRGLHEVAKAVAKSSKTGETVTVAPGGARLCVLAQDCNEASYTKLVKALCAEKGVPLFEVPSASDLGIWVGLCKLDKEGNPRKVVKTSVAAIVDFGEPSRELDIVLEYLKSTA